MLSVVATAEYCPFQAQFLTFESWDTLRLKLVFGFSLRFLLSVGVVNIVLSYDYFVRLLLFIHYFGLNKQHISGWLNARACDFGTHA